MNARTVSGHENVSDSPSPDHGCLARLDRVTARFGDNTVFSDISFCLRKGEHLVLLGNNGAGKSTLLRLLQGELRPFQAPASDQDEPPSGRIYWNFEGKEEPYALVALKHVRLVSPGQQRNYLRQGWTITGEEIVLSGLDNAAMLHGEMSGRHYARAAELAGAAGAEELMGMTAPAMSQGQLRLVLLLRALMSNPALLLLDEPFDGLDAASRERITSCMALVAERGSTLLISAHRDEDIPSFISGALLLRNGRITRVEPPLPEQHEIAAPAAPPVQQPSEASRAHARPVSHQTVPLVELEHVDVFTNRQHILFDINWRILPGDQWVLSGANGSGKSTLLRLLHGEEFAAYGGVLRWRGGPRPSLEELRASVGYVSDRLQYVYDYDISAEEVVISGLRGTIGLYHEPEESERALARSCLDRMGLCARSDRGFHSLSSGTARRVLLARALAASPPLLLLDEPCSGLDARSRAFFLRSLSLLADKGVTIVYVTHHDQDKSAVFTHELRLDNGRVTFSGRRFK